MNTFIHLSLDDITSLQYQTLKYATNKTVSTFDIMDNDNA